mmetsp:Transcript_573/g.1812  ORF Transcript_573/g.1812 Transcript_573/m.1812 type:complete len:239 (-) Transcript_573:2968-3684(-)|eukprot:CAMPEP_0182910968 /NCGR_PEP_ID=MMETSP0034_2-20130328/36639_1 /TAXON_ID=156128 /ORGANISM="Nephroselmis pyriformis, Strain CCMP717" /LENGTH=238 /DNA_ID=CAMNT_0025047405 /DNA_START=139 /DNA_END=855 /DNA_ORIENTATION=-
MGAGASSHSKANFPEFKDPVPRPDGSVLYLVTPMDDAVRQRSAQVLLEVSAQGFRLLRPSGEEPLLAFPFPQVHSWAHATDKFSFRFFEERTKEIKQYAFVLDQVPHLMDTIRGKIGQILEDRKSKSMGQEGFDELLAKLKDPGTISKLEALKAAVAGSYFSSEQGKDMVMCVESSFDKVEAACALHPRLVDQNHFSRVLEALEDRADRENVWHRLASAKQGGKRASQAGGKGVQSQS